MNVLACFSLCLLIFPGPRAPLHACDCPHSYPEPNSEKLDEAAVLRSHAVSGMSIQIDPGFAYYQGRTSESIAEEIELAGFKTVHYFITNENHINRELIEAFHARGIAVWGMVLGNGTYSTDLFPPGWQEWGMKTVKPGGFGSFTFLSHFSEGYLQWKKQSLSRIVQEYPFDGIEIAEAYMPEWDGIKKGTHGDVGPNAQRAFRKMYNHQIPNFTDSSAADFFKKVPEVYRDWVEFRVEGVNRFLHELVNGKGGIREARPDILVATWSLAIDAGPGSVSLLREHQGLDVPAMVNLVKPDVHYIQTHWPDWIKPDLPPDYMRKYTAFYDEIRRAQPDLPLGLQADIGSDRSMVKSWTWLGSFHEEAARMGYQTTTAYEYHIGGYIFSDPPRLKQAKLHGPDSLLVSFSKRVDPKSAGAAANYRFFSEGHALEVSLQKLNVDGNRVWLISEDFPGANFTVEVSNVRDDPSTWIGYARGYPSNEIIRGSKLTVTKK